MYNSAQQPEIHFFFKLESEPITLGDDYRYGGMYVICLMKEGRKQLFQPHRKCNYRPLEWLECNVAVIWTHTHTHTTAAFLWMTSHVSVQAGAAQWRWGDFFNFITHLINKINNCMCVPNCFCTEHIIQYFACISGHQRAFTLRGSV